MMALILSVGFIVDDAIVMLENAVRLIEAGESPLQASIRGAQEIGFTIVTITVSLASVFIPILFMGGILGRLFREFAVTIVSTVLISGVVSITLTPMLCSRFLRVVHTKHGLAGVMDRAFDRLRAGYGASLRWVLAHRPVMLVVFAAVLYATVKMVGIVPKGFIPDTDNDSLRVQLRAAQGTSYYEMVQHTQRIADLLKQNPGVDSLMANTGGGGNQNTARFALQLIPRAERRLTSQEIAQQLRLALGRFPGFRAFVNVPAALQIGGFRGNSSFNLTVQSLNYDELSRWAPRLEAAIAALPEVLDVSNDMELKSPRVNLVIDRDKAAAVGLNAAQITESLSDGFGQQWVSTIYGKQTQYRVLLELDPQYQERADSLRKVSFKTSVGNLVPLESVMDFKEDVGPLSVNHYGQLPAVNISFGLRPGVSLGSAIDRVTAVAREVLPPTVTTSFQGSAKVFQASLSNLSLLFFLAIGVVYIVLGMLYESFIHPITILSGLPSAALGGLLTLWLFGSELNIYSFVGLILLIGLVMKNAIMQIDFALDAERQRGKVPTEAIYDGCMTRFRPIMMTTMATLFGAIPIAIGLGAGAEARRPLGLAVVGGLVVSQIITLYLTPVVYTYLARCAPTATNPPPAASSRH
jgi:HAE1 family hydrophobic/amphiphilic exporter-1